MTFPAITFYDETGHPAATNLDEILAKHGPQGISPFKVEITQAVGNLEIELDWR